MNNKRKIKNNTVKLFIAISSILILSISSLLMGCGEGVFCDYSIGDKLDDNYTVLDRRSSDQYLIYDNDTKILYLANLENNGGYGIIVRYSLCPYYVMNENNEPVVGVYNGDIEWEDIDNEI